MSYQIPNHDALLNDPLLRHDARVDIDSEDDDELDGLEEDNDPDDGCGSY